MPASLESEQLSGLWKKFCAYIRLHDQKKNKKKKDIFI